MALNWMWYKELLAALANNTTNEYVIALGVFTVCIVLLRIFKFYAIKRFRVFAAKTKTEVDNFMAAAADAVGWSFYIILSLFIASRFLHLPAYFNKLWFYVFLITIPYYLFKMIQAVVEYGSKRMYDEKEPGETVDTFAMHMLGNVVKGIVVIIALIVLLHTLGYNVSGILAGLGIGGIAIAFALQNVLSDIFASISIYLDKPFKPGDFIVVGNEQGTVKRIGIKSTRIQALQGEEIILANKELTESRVHNYKKMENRRVVFSFGVTYDTPSKKLRKIPELIGRIISESSESSTSSSPSEQKLATEQKFATTQKFATEQKFATTQKFATLDRVHFTKFGDSALIYEVVYFVASNDYKVYSDLQQEINLKIKECFEKEKIEMAYPTQTVYVNKGKR